jgi:hypothetical protein
MITSVKINRKNFFAERHRLFYGDNLMKRSPHLVAGLLTTVIMAAVSGAAYAESNVPTASETRLIKIADKDFGRLSADGMSAFNDVHLARIAIFDGKTDEAAKFVTDAQTSLGKAKTDDTLFLKAESEFQTPSKATKTPKASSEKTSAPIAWIPIDNDIEFLEAFQPTTGKAAAIGMAKKALARGDGANALKAIKLAEVDVDYTVAMAPLEQSIADVDEAANLIASHDYYGASQSLKKAEDGVRFDEFVDVTNIKGKASPAIAKSK